jgi:transmembrane sensor
MSDPNLSPAEQEAVRWCVARHSGDWSAAAEAKFEQWLAASADHRQAHLKVARAWSVAGQLNEPAVSVREKPARNYRSAALAALALAVLAPFVAWEGERWWNGVPEAIATTRGQFKTLTLADSSEVQLDADSEAIVRVGYRGRSAELRRGAALFVVVHDDARPFEVKAGVGRIVDLGTRFDIDIRSGHVRVEVFEGRVAMHTVNGERELVAGQGAAYDGSGVLSPTVAAAGALPAWREGKLAFRDEPLGEALQRIARYHPVQFEFADPALADLRISGLFRADDLGLFLKTLEAGFPLRAGRRDGTTVVLSRITTADFSRRPARTDMPGHLP